MDAQEQAAAEQADANGDGQLNAPEIIEATDIVEAAAEGEDAQ